MAYGLTEQGFVLKRFNEILAEKRQRAIQLFQDLVEEGDVVDTSESSLLGRLIALDVVADADLWEAAQLVYSAFDPNSATGIPLDNLVALSGVTRLSQSATRADAYLTASVNTTIPSGSIVQSVLTATDFSTTSDVVFNSVQTVGVGVNVVSLGVNNSYTLRYRASTDSSYISVQAVSYTHLRAHET